MELTLNRLAKPVGGFNTTSLAIGLAPLGLLILVMIFNTDWLIPEKVVEVKPVYFEPVAVVFVNTTSNTRAVTFDATIEAEHRFTLRSQTEARIAAVNTAVGKRVNAGDALCQVRPLGAENNQVLYSPITGVVSAVNGSPGTILQAGEACVSVLDPLSMVAKGGMTERQAQVITPGDPASISTIAGPVQSQVRVIYPEMDSNPFNPRPFEVPLHGSAAIADGSEAVIEIDTEQIVPTLVPFEALTIEREHGLAVRVVTGRGPTGHVRTLPIVLVAATRSGFYVEGLPLDARLIIAVDEYNIPADGETVRIGRVGY